MASAFPAYLAKYAELTDVQEYTPSVVASEDVVVGDLFYYDTSTNTTKRCGADPALIAGVSEIASTQARLLTPNNKVPLRIITGFQAVFAFSSTTTPAASHIGDTYGVTRSAAAQWQLDTAKTGADARLLVVEVDIANGIFFCHFLGTELQFAAVA